MRCLGIDIIYLDMDGVLVDFDRGVQELFGVPMPPGRRNWDYAYEEDFGLSKTQFWRSLGHDFWAALPMTKEAPGIIEMLQGRGLWGCVRLLSSPTLEPGSWSGKAEWVRKNIPSLFYGNRLVLTQDKLLHCRPTSLLIDDRYETCSLWTRAGGPAFNVPRPWNPLWEHEDSLLRLLEEHLDYLGVGVRRRS